MKIQLKLLMFIVILLAGILATGLLLDVIEISEAQTMGLRMLGVLGVGYLVVLSGYLLFKKEV